MLIILFPLLVTLNITDVLCLIQNLAQGKAGNTWDYHVFYFRNTHVYGDSLMSVLGTISSASGCKEVDKKASIFYTITDFWLPSSCSELFNWEGSTKNSSFNAYGMRNVSSCIFTGGCLFIPYRYAALLQVQVKNGKHVSVSVWLGLTENAGRLIRRDGKVFLLLLTVTNTIANISSVGTMTWNWLGESAEEMGCALSSSRTVCV